jgi:hypothetical protein
VHRSARAFRLSGRHRGVNDVLSAILLIAITIVLMVFVYFIRLPLTPSVPSLSYQAVTGATKPVWGDPTDCRPNAATLPYNWEYYLSNGTSNPTYKARYNLYMNWWWAECENGTNGTYNDMNVSEIEVAHLSAPVPLADVEFQFVCVNTTPKYLETVFAQGPLNAMEWVPGSNQSLAANAPTLGKCATASPNPSGANSVYYNRLGYFDPVDYNVSVLSPAQTLVIYVHTPDSVLEAPNPLYDQSYWNQPDQDDYHGAPPWCFTVPGACTINLIDTQYNPGIVLTSIPLYVV